MRKPKGKLDYAVVLEIRRKYSDPLTKTSMRKLAKEYSISKSLVFKIIHEMIYKPAIYEREEE